MNAMNQDFAISEAIALPDMRRRWWESKTRLNIRPVLWSLRNKPEDWKYDYPRPYCIVHIPSNHEFWIASSFWFYHLYSGSGCSCSQAREGRFSLLQKLQFRAAYRSWRRQHRSVEVAAVNSINEQFAKHFLP